MVGGGSSHEQKSSAVEEEVIHKGGCQCGRVRWEAKGPKSVVATRCNCSICSTKGNINFSVPCSNFKLIHGGAKVEEFITTYTFGTHTAEHTFCKVCGISSFYIPRSGPDSIALTVECVESIDPGTLTHIEVKDVDGKN